METRYILETEKKRNPIYDKSGRIKSIQSIDEDFSNGTVKIKFYQGEITLRIYKGELFAFSKSSENEGVHTMIRKKLMVGYNPRTALENAKQSIVDRVNSLEARAFNQALNSPAKKIEGTKVKDSPEIDMSQLSSLYPNFEFVGAH